MPARAREKAITANPMERIINPPFLLRARRRPARKILNGDAATAAPRSDAEDLKQDDEWRRGYRMRRCKQPVPVRAPRLAHSGEGQHSRCRGSRYGQSRDIHALCIGRAVDKTQVCVPVEARSTVGMLAARHFAHRRERLRRRTLGRTANGQGKCSLGEEHRTDQQCCPPEHAFSGKHPINITPEPGPPVDSDQTTMTPAPARMATPLLRRWEHGRAACYQNKIGSHFAT